MLLIFLEFSVFFVAQLLSNFDVIFVSLDNSFSSSMCKISFALVNTSSGKPARDATSIPKLLLAPPLTIFRKNIIELLYSQIRNGGKTFVVSEHNTQFIDAASYICELVNHGSYTEVVYSDERSGIGKCKKSIIKKWL